MLASWIKSARVSLDGAIYGLTDESITQALIDAHQRGVQVRLVHDKTQAAGRRDVTNELLRSHVPSTSSAAARAAFCTTKSHHRQQLCSAPAASTGRTMPSAKNDENFVVLDDVAPKFQTEFDRL